MTTPPKRNLSDWIEGYLKYTENQESPEKLHMWTGFCVLSAILRRRVWMSRGAYTLYPNIYVMIVAPSGKIRKSITMELGIALLQKAMPDFPMSIGKTTAEGMVKWKLNRPVTEPNPNDPAKPFIKYESYLLIYADELATFFGYERQAASRMAIFLTDTYSCKEKYEHITKGDTPIAVYNNYPVLLAATDPRNLKVLPDEAIGGLIGRTIFVTANKRRKVIAWPEKGGQQLHDELLTDLLRISDLKGEMAITKTARDYFTTWYEKFSDVTNDDPRLDAFHERAHDTAWKIAMLLSISQRHDLVVDLQHIMAGIKIIEDQLPEFARIASWSATSLYAQNRARFIDTLRRTGGFATRSIMMRALSLSLDEILAIEESLEAEGTIEKVAAGRKAAYKLSPDEMAGDPYKKRGT